MSARKTINIFDIEDLVKLREEVTRMSIEPLRFLGKEYYVFICPKKVKLPNQSIHNKLAGIWFNLFKRKKLSYLAKGNTVRMI